MILGAIQEGEVGEIEIQPYYDALLDEMNESTKLMLFKLFIKLADISHPARPMEQHLRLSEMVITLITLK